MYQKFNLRTNMRYLLVVFIFLTSNSYCASLIKEEKVRIENILLTISKIEFDGHTYIHFRNPWTNAGNEILHDPKCACLENKILNKEIHEDN